MEVTPRPWMAAADRPVLGKESWVGGKTVTLLLLLANLHAWGIVGGLQLTSEAPARGTCLQGVGSAPRPSPQHPREQLARPWDSFRGLRGVTQPLPRSAPLAAACLPSTQAPVDLWQVLLRSLTVAVARGRHATGRSATDSAQSRVGLDCHAPSHLWYWASSGCTAQGDPTQ